MSETGPSAYFRLFNEIGIIEQLSRTMFEARLPPGFVVAQFSVLNHLVRTSDGRTPLALARAFQVPKTSMTHSLAVLERADLIEFRPNPKDGRSKLVHITDKGRQFREDAIAALAPDIARISKSISLDHVAALLPGLTALREVLDADRDRPEPD